IIFPEPQEERYVPRGEGAQQTYVRVDDDRNFADALERFGKTLIPISLDPRPPLMGSGSYNDVAFRMMLEDLRLQADDLLEELDKLELFDETFDDDGPSIHARARRRAMYERIDELSRKLNTLDKDTLRKHLLPDLDTTYNTVEMRVFENEYRKIAGLRGLDHLAKPDDEGIEGIPPAYQEYTPISLLAQASSTTGFVNHESEGVIRSVPLWIKYRGGLYPQMGLSLACLMLDVPIVDIQINPESVVIPLPDRPDIVIPTRRHRSKATGEEYIGFLDVVYFGNDRWEFMYDYPNHSDTKAHLPLTMVWNVVLERRRLEENVDQFDSAVQHIYSEFEPDKLKAYQDNLAPLDDIGPRLAIADEVIEFANSWIGSGPDVPIDRLHETLRAEGYTEQEATHASQLIITTRALPKLKDGIVNMADSLRQNRENLARNLNGKAVLLGWTATAAIADFVPTSLHDRCPGVVIHGAVYNGIMTGNLLKEAPRWWVPLMTLLFGCLAIVIVSGLNPSAAVFNTALLVGGWILLNGSLLFDYANTTLEPGAPLAAIIAVWTGCTLFRFIAERIERARITERFNSYVDPGLVSYVIEDPERAHLDGATKELSVVFTDLQGFTTLTEILKEKTVDLLNEYMGLMVPIIRSEDKPQHRRGYVNKFLGDGIMFFFGAPRENPHHAVDALETAIRMQQAMPAFNQSLQERDLPPVYMRVGIASGNMVVGDAGPPDASDYTVLGDNVNLAARLESANKALGTFTMVNARCVELLENKYLLRPLANLQVVGKSEGVMAYEPIALVGESTDEQKRYVVLTADMVDAYLEGRFTDCITASEKLAEEFGQSQLIGLYREACETYLEEPPEEFAGLLTLTSK
ncbi:MAG: adenylate/guanylate cyclase domain-containing protein, partial [Planctomycetota bacterium]